MAPPKHKESTMQSCIQDTATSSVYAASKKFGIPRSTLRYRMSSKWKKTTTTGPAAVLSEEEEGKIVSWIIQMQRRGFPVQRRSLLNKVKEFLTANPRENPFKNNRPGRKWFKSFMRRHPTLSIRTPECVTSASARVSEADIRKWFDDVSSWLDEEGIKDIMSDPSRIFNGDETSFYLHPKTREVIAQKGSRNVYEMEHADGKKNITVMFSFSASGKTVTPLVILPGKRMRQEVAQSFPSTWGIGQSERGWMTIHNFGQYIRKVFHPYLVKHKIKLPVIFFVDGHSSHVALEVADLCLSLGIVLIALYPNTTRILQPADVSIFKPLKDQWKQEVEDWRFEKPGEIFTVKHFGSVLEKAVNKGIKEPSIKNGFRVCGLYPFNADNVDYSKCIAVADNISNTTNNGSPSDGLETPTSDEPTSSARLSPAFSTISSSDKEVPSMVLCPPLVPGSYGTAAGSETTRPAADKLSHFQTGTSGTSVVDPAAHNITFTLSPYVSVHTDKIKQALELMGPSTLDKVHERADENDTHERNVVRFFYQEFIQPYVNVQSTPSDYRQERKSENRESFAEGDLGLPRIISCGEGERTIGNTFGDDNDDTTVLGELTISTDGEVSFNGECSQQEVMRLLDESNQQNSSLDIQAPMNGTSTSITDPTDKQSQAGVLCDATNTRRNSRKTSISDFLKLPPVPRRSGKHRNYTKKFYPVLTAGERLEEIRRVEKEKQDIEQAKKIRAIERQKLKQQQLEAKQKRDEERKKKKLDAELQKREKVKRNLKRPKKTGTQDRDKQAPEPRKKQRKVNLTAEQKIKVEKEN